jgi:intracellular septation protein A
MKLWTYKRPFTIDGIDGVVHTAVSTSEMKSTMFINGAHVAQDIFVAKAGQPLRNNHLAYTLADGRKIDIEAGYVGWWKTQIAVYLNGVLRFESAPGAVIQWPTSFGKTYGKGIDPTPEDTEQVRIEQERQKAQFQRNKPSLFFDIGIALLFFVVAKFTNLTTAALVSAAAGIIGAIVQRITKIDLLGGLAAFGIVMSLITAGFAFAFQDDDMVKMRSTILGVFTALLFLTDGLFGGRYLGARLVRYMPHPDTHAGRLSIGIGCVGLVMALLNYGVAKVFSTDAWLFYTTFLDTVLALVLTFGAIRYAQPKPSDRAA